MKGISGKDGRWEGRYTAGYDSKTGKRVVKSVLGKTQAAVKAKLKTAIEEMRELDVSCSEEYTVATWLRTWYALYAKPNVRVATADRYQLMIETHTIPQGSVGKWPGQPEKRQGKSWAQQHDCRSVHLMLHCAFQRAVKERLIPRNPTEDCIAPKVQKIEMKILPADHIRNYLDAANARGLLPMFYLEPVSGLRKGKLVALRWDDLDTQNQTISVSKQYIKNQNEKPERETDALQAQNGDFCPPGIYSASRHFSAPQVVKICNKKTPEIRRFQGFPGAAGRIRTADLILTKDALYLLSYSSIKWRPGTGSNRRPLA